jgi:hypothetical protein
MIMTVPLSVRISANLRVTIKYALKRKLQMKYPNAIRPNVDLCIGVDLIWKASLTLLSK